MSLESLDLKKKRKKEGTLDFKKLLLSTLYKSVEQRNTKSLISYPIGKDRGWKRSRVNIHMYRQEYFNHSAAVEAGTDPGWYWLFLHATGPLASSL